MKKYLPLLLLPLLIGINAIGSSFFQNQTLVTETSSIVSAAGTTTLVATSNQVQIITGAAAQSVKLPDQTTLRNGSWYFISNESTGIVSVKDSSSGALATLKNGTWGHFYSKSKAAPTGNWAVRVGTQEASIDVTQLQNLSTDFLPQYLNNTRGDIRYYPKNNFTKIYTGFSQPVLLNDSGFIDPTLLTPGLGQGDVVGPGVSVDNTVVRFNGLTGAIIQGGPMIEDDSGNLTGVGSVAMGGALSGVTTLNTSGDAVIGGGLLVKNPLFQVNATANRVGVNTISPNATLDIVGVDWILPAPAATPNIALLRNSQMSASIDETLNTFEFEAKSSSGVTIRRSLGPVISTTLTSGHILVGNAGNVATDVAMTGDIGIDNAGVTAIQSGVIVNADISASAQIDRMKLADSATQNAVAYNNGSGILTSEAAFKYTDSTNALVLTSGTISVPGTGSGSEQFGAGAGCESPSGLCLGNGSVAGPGDRNIAIGHNAQAGQTALNTKSDVIAIGSEIVVNPTAGFTGMGVGSQLVVGGQDNLRLGNQGGSMTGIASTAVGMFAGTSTFSSSIVLGNTAVSTADNQLVFGSSTAPVNDWYVGEGVVTASPSNLALQPSGGSGADVAAGTFTINGAKGTGSATTSSAYISLQVATAGVSSSTLQSLVERVRIGRVFGFPTELVKPVGPASGYVGLFASANKSMYQIDASSNAVCLAECAPEPVMASNIDWSLNRTFTKDLSANTTLTFSNLVAGKTIVVRITNTASNYTVTWPFNIKWPAGTIPTETVGAKTDVITCHYDGKNIFCSSVQNF